MDIPQYYNVVEESRYAIQVKAATSIADVSDNFLSADEIKERFGTHYLSSYQTRFIDEALVRSELEKITKPLADQEVTSVTIDDPELLEIIKERGVSTYVVDVRRRGNKLSRYKPRPRKQTGPMKRDARAIWDAMQRVFREKHGPWMPHICIRDRSACLMRFYKRCFSWKALAKFIPKEQHRWARMIWNNPEENMP